MENEERFLLLMDMITSEQPSIKIIEEPGAQRFRYEREGRTAALPGVNSTPDNKTYPTIEVNNVSGEVIVIVSCVTAEQPYRPHPHKLEGRDCKKGVCLITFQGDPPFRHRFENLGIQSVKRPEMENSMNERNSQNINPFRENIGNLREYLKKVDLYKLRLCFELYQKLPERLRRVCKPIVSQVIYQNNVAITGICSCSAIAAGGDDIILLCNNTLGSDIKIRFFEKLADGNVIWEAFGKFSATDIYKRVAIKFKTPPYRKQDIEQAVQVWIQLVREADKSVSEALSFEYKPNPVLINRKRTARELFESKRPCFEKSQKEREIAANLQLPSTTPWLDIWRPDALTSHASPIFGNLQPPAAYNPADASTSNTGAMYANLQPPAAYNPEDASTSNASASYATQTAMNGFPANNTSPSAYNIPVQQITDPSFDYNYQQDLCLNADYEALFNQFDTSTGIKNNDLNHPQFFNNYVESAQQQQQHEQQQEHLSDTSIENLSDILSKLCRDELSSK